MLTRIAHITGDRLKIDLEFHQTPSKASMVNIRPIGIFTAAERAAIRLLLQEAVTFADEMSVFDTTNMEEIDSYGMGAILLLNGEWNRNQQAFALNVCSGEVSDYLERYGVLQIVRQHGEISGTA